MKNREFFIVAFASAFVTSLLCELGYKFFGENGLFAVGILAALGGFVILITESSSD